MHDSRVIVAGRCAANWAREDYSYVRIGGTFVGAGLATALASTLRPDPIALTALIVLFAWPCYSIVIAFLLVLAGLPARKVAMHRLANTALGGAIALLAFIPPLAIRRKEPCAEQVATGRGDHCV